MSIPTATSTTTPPTTTMRRARSDESRGRVTHVKAEPISKRVYVPSERIKNMTNQEIITDFNNLYRAFKRSQNNRSYTRSSMYFQIDAVTKIREIQKTLIDHSFKCGGYAEFTVYYPKERIIKACRFKDKIVQHVLCDNILVKAYPNICITDNYAGQKGKGTSSGLNRTKDQILKFCSEHKNGYFYKGDIHKYYYNIDHETAKDIMHYHYPKDIWWLIDEFIDSTEGDAGIALGNQINTVVSNLYLDGMDKFITQDLGITYYGRYADDFRLIHESKEYLKYCVECIEEYLHTLKLELNPKSQISTLSCGISFLGFHFSYKNNELVIKVDNGKKRAYRRKFNKLCKKVKNGELPLEVLEKSYKSWSEHASFATDKSIFDYYIRRIKELKNDN